jgi:hypothetical protein
MADVDSADVDSWATADLQADAGLWDAVASAEDLREAAHAADSQLEAAVVSTAAEAAFTVVEAGLTVEADTAKPQAAVINFE